MKQLWARCITHNSFGPKDSFTCPGPAEFCEVEIYWEEAPMSNDRDPLLVERQKTHGDFATNAEISQKLKAIFDQYGIRSASIIHAEALDMIALKLSRILSGQANFKDHWRDLSGYALLAMEVCDDDKN